MLYYFPSSRQFLRRSSDGGGFSNNLDLPAMRNFDPATILQHRRPQTSLSGGGRLVPSNSAAAAAAAAAGLLPPRSWHPSPFASDEEMSATSAAEEPQFYKEEKKNKIKMEIARRRQQIEENACLHEELTRLARLRETAEFGPTSHHRTAHAGTLSGAGSGGLAADHLAATGGTSVLKSVDEILRDPFTSAATGSAFRARSALGNLNSGLYTAGPMTAADMYTGSTATDFSPLNSDLNDLAHARRVAASAAGHVASAAGHLLENPLLATAADPYGRFTKPYAAATAIYR
jgi:hypothetical protein